jgi:hypothetical protein
MTMKDPSDRPARRARPILWLIAVLLAAIVLIASFMTVRMERGAPSALDENDDEGGGLVLEEPVHESSPSTEEDDELTNEYEDVPPGTADEDFDEIWLEEPPEAEMVPDPGISTEEDDEYRQEDAGEDDDENQ